MEKVFCIAPGVVCDVLDESKGNWEFGNIN